MEAQSQPRTAEIQERLTPEYAARFLFHSFRHSQGNLDLQSEIFQYAHLLRPAWKIDAESKSKIRDISTRMIIAFLGGNGEGKKDTVVHRTHLKHSKTTIVSSARTDVESGLVIMEGTFSDPVFNRYALTVEITGNIIGRDLVFLNKETGRERAPASAQKPLLDPWLSFIVHFGLNRHPTGIAELDEMYRDVRAFVTRPSEEINLRAFNDVLRIYQEKHPGAPIDLTP